MEDHLMTFLVFAIFVLSVSQLVHSDDYYDTCPSPTILESDVSKGAVASDNLTTPANATEKGAFCLDGSEPAYQFDVGFGEGVNNWVVFLEGGGWCYTYEYCAGRIGSDYNVGSRSKMKWANVGGILSSDVTVNPDFYNWNKVYVRYCDAASFLADVEEPKQFGNTTLYFRGARIFKATMEDLLEKGMKNANNILFSGSSAGGLANLLHCDNFQAFVPLVPRVKCVADTAFFIHGKDFLPGLAKREKAYFGIVETHELADLLPKTCTSRMQDPRLCIFPEYFVEDIQTPLFMVQSAYDQFQVQFLIELDSNKSQGCYEQGEKNCTLDDLKKITDFGTTLVESFPKFPFSSNGFFVDSCTYHDQILTDTRWNHCPEPTLKNKTIAQAVGDWFFERDGSSFPFRVINKTDFPFNCLATATG